MRTAKSRILATAFALTLSAVAATANAASNTATAGYVQVAHLVGKNDRQHFDYRDGHSHGPVRAGHGHGKKHHAKKHYTPYVPPCHPVKKIRYDHYGNKVKVVKTMCYTPYGAPYTVRGSRRVVPLYTKHGNRSHGYTGFAPAVNPYWSYGYRSR